MPDWTIQNLLPADAPPPLEPDRGGYTLTMRECSGAEDVLERLRSVGPDDSRRAHVGWGSFRNLDIAAARRSSWLLLLDVNIHQFRVWEAVRTALRDPAATDAGAFINLVLPLLPTQPRLRQFATSTRTWLTGDLERPGSWLFAERPKRFAWIQGLFRDGRAAVGCMDLRGVPQGDADPFSSMAGHMADAVRQGLHIPCYGRVFEHPADVRDSADNRSSSLNCGVRYQRRVLKHDVVSVNRINRSDILSHVETAAVLHFFRRRSRRDEPNLVACLQIVEFNL